jgi:ubiquinone biosynthesis protein UbiJ
VLHSVTASSVNHLLRSNSWARDKLAPFAGKTARFECPPFSLALTVQENGEVTAVDAAATAPDATVKLTAGLMLRLLARDQAAWAEIEVDGDTAFATVLNQIARNLRWDVEEDLSRVFGDIAAHRIVQTGKTLDQWRAQAADNLARSFAEYWTEEQPLIARARDIAQFNHEVDVLRDDAARFEKRLQHFLNRQSAQ